MPPTTASRPVVATSPPQALAANDLVAMALAALPHGVALFDPKGRLQWVNARWHALWMLPLGLDQPGTTAAALHAAQVQRLQPGQAAPTPGTAGHPELWPLADGRVIAIRRQTLPNGHSLTLHDDVGTCSLAAARSAQTALHDTLTQLPARQPWLETLSAQLERRAEGEALAVLCLDLHHFRRVNDTWGHAHADALLQAVAERLKQGVRGQDLIARLGADDFAVLQTGGQQPEGATALARRLLNLLAEPFEVDGHPLHLAASIGVAMAPFDATDADGLLRRAHTALNRAKAEGQNQWRFFEPAMDEALQRRHQLENDLRHAVDNAEFELAYQPQIALSTHRVAGVEALLRWNHPSRGRAPPLDFIPLAEENGLIVPIGRWVLQQACRDAAQWPAHVRVAVNVSAVQFKSRTLVADVLAALHDAGLPPQRLELEITEAMLLQDTEHSLAVMHELHNHGIQLSMDDFGTGYSSLSYLRRFPFDRLKIDRSFVRDVDTNVEAQAIVRAVAGLGRSLGMATTVEGVETTAQLERVRAEGCLEVQGYLFSMPRPASEVAEMIRNGAGPQALRPKAA